LTNAILMGTLLAPLGITVSHGREAPLPRLGVLPLARRDVERLRQLWALQRRLRDTSASPRAQRAIAHRHIFPDALTWLEIHGQSPDLVAHWKALTPQSGESAEAGPPAADGETPGPFTRRRRRRRRGRRRFTPPPEH
jgi:hypothetical protein